MHSKILTKHFLYSLKGDGWVDDVDAHLNDATVTTPEMDDVEELDGFQYDMDTHINRYLNCEILCP